MSTAEAPAGSNEFVDFWNDILVPSSPNTATSWSAA